MTERVVAGVSVTDVVVARVKSVRRRRGLSAADLAARCARLGAPEITANVLANIESGRRQVNVNQLAVLALALDVAPVHLLDAEDGVVEVTASALESAEVWAAWVSGRAPLPESDAAAFWAYCLENAPQDETDAYIELARSRTTSATMKVVAQLREETDAQMAHVRAVARRVLDQIQETAMNGDTGEINTAIEQARNALNRASDLGWVTPTSGLDRRVRASPEMQNDLE